MSNILITGASGFIGSFLVEHGIQAGHTIYAAIRKSSNTQYLKDKKIKTLYLNLSDKQAMVQNWNTIKKQIGSFEYVIHNAGISKALNKTEFDTTNYQYTINLIESLSEAEMIPVKFIFISSLAAYGPGDEKTLTPIKTTDTPAPITNYGISKLKAEQYLFNQKRIPFIVFRPTGVYGPRDTDFHKYLKLLNNHIEVYTGGINQMLSFIYVKDLVTLIFRSLTSEISNKGYFVTDSKNYSSKQFALIIKEILAKKTVRIVIPSFLVKLVAFISEQTARLTNKASLLNLDKFKEITSRNWSCDSNETMTDFNFKSQYDLKIGLTETIKWYKENGWL